MADLAKKHDLIPNEQCAAPGKNGNEGSLLKVFHTDHLRTMHILHAIGIGDPSAGVLQFCGVDVPDMGPFSKTIGFDLGPGPLHKVEK